MNVERIEYKIVFMALMVASISFFYKGYGTVMTDTVWQTAMFISGMGSLWLAAFTSIFMVKPATEAQVREWDAYYNRKRF